MSSTALASYLPTTTTLEGTASAVTQLLEAPASGARCVHWRLRVVERVSAGMELVHEFVSPEPIELAWRETAEGPRATLRVIAEDARIVAIPQLFHEGSAGAAAVAKHFGLRGVVRVEEVIIKQGEPLVAEGVLCDPASALGRGPFRGVEAPCELMDATLHVGGLVVRPALLPWALGTAAALFGTVGAVTALAHWMAPHRVPDLGPGAPAEIGPAKPVRPVWP